MKTTVWLVMFASLGVSVVMVVGLRAEERKGLPPLVVDTDEPLLLEEPPPPKPFDPFAIPAGPKANNRACYACHANYETEPFVNWHADANVGCVKCHGPSSDHRNDESNTTPPDKIFGPDTIKTLCADCHDEHNVAAADVIARWQERAPAKTNPEEIVCTDCHGRHRLKFRTIWWDKKTRELVIRKEGQRIKPAVDLTVKEKEDEPTANSTPP